MKCPKCGYLGFERADRCRNCGHDFSLTESSALPELPIRTGEPTIAPLEDLALADAPIRRHARPGPDLAGELPLFGPSAGAASYAGAGAANLPALDDAPLVRRPVAPRPPLAVRRPTPELPRRRPESPRLQSLDLDLTPAPAAPPGKTSSEARASSPRGSSETAAPSSSGADPSTSRQPGGPVADAASLPLTTGPISLGLGADRALLDRASVEPRAPDAIAAGLFARSIAAVIDIVILAGVDAVVVYFTMQICGLTVQELTILPKAPLIAFLTVQNGGYLVAFTVGGQTLGKMVARIKVVAAESRSRLDPGRALLRTLMWAVLALPAGLGFLTALLSADRRGLHDRLAGTRVVRALA